MTQVKRDNLKRTLVQRTRHGRAAYKGATSGTIWTPAHWNVVDDIADGVLATSARARIQAFTAQTSLVTRTIGVEHAFWTTAGVRITMELGQTAANAIVALGIGTTW